MSTSAEVDTSQGVARLHVSPARGRTRGAVVLGHGAGGGVGSADLEALARRLPDLGWAVARVEQPWRVAGRRVAPAPTVLDAVWRETVPAALDVVGADRLVVGGRSAGARVACRTAAELGAVGVLALAFPLHPPGRPERSRAEELRGVTSALLVLQGERDPFGRPAEFPVGLPVQAVPGADHGFAVPRRAEVTGREALELLTEAAVGWLGRLG